MTRVIVHEGWTAATITPEAFLDPLVLRSANQLVARSDLADILDTGEGRR